VRSILPANGRQSCSIPSAASRVWQSLHRMRNNGEVTGLREEEESVQYAREYG